MLTESIKKRIVKSLVEEIAALDATQLELVGHGLVEVIEHQKLVHHGMNKDHKFVGYTVDTFSNGSTIVAQYSTEQNYFQNEGSDKKPVFKKIDKDIQSAEKHRKPTGTTKIYLLSNKEEPPSFRAKFNKTDAAKRLGETLILLDARELAKRVYELSIANPDVANFFRGFFAGFSVALDNFEYYGKLPALCENHQSDDGIARAIRSHFAAGQKVAVLHGVSGSGKTQAAIDFVHWEAESFENYVWISGEDWKPNTSLTAIQRTRGGTPVNVVGLFNASKTILVVDKLDREPDMAALQDLQPGFDKGGVVLVTSQISLPGKEGHLPMPTFARDVAIRILGEDPSDPSAACERFVAACRFSPLLLSAARSIVESQRLDRTAFYEEILASPQVVDGDDGTSIMKRILQRLEAPAREALTKIAQSGSAAHDADFLTHFLGTGPRVSLQRLAILMAASTPGVMYVHDLICKAIQAAVDTRALVAAIEAYMEARHGEMTPSILRQIHLCRKQLLEEHTRRGQREPDWLGYALLQIADTKKGVYATYADRRIDPTMSLAALMCLIDAREQYAYSLDDNNERQTFYGKCIEEYTAALTTADRKNRAELLHHLGKALRRMGREDEALSRFRELLELEPEWHATHGQIAHLGARRGASPAIRAGGEESLRFLIGTILDDASTVPLRVSMAALTNLRSYDKVVRELVQDARAVEALAEVIAMSALEGLDQFYEAFVSFTSKFGYAHEQVCVDLARTLSDMLSVLPNAIGRDQQGSACEGLTNVALAARRAGDQSLSSRLSELACRCADAMLAAGEISPYEARVIAKAFTTAGAPKRAIEVIDGVAADKISHWILYRKAEAQLALDLPEALETAQEALRQALSDERAQAHVSSYHDLVSQCFERRGDVPAARQHVETALGRAGDAKYRAALQARLEKLTGLQASGVE